MQQPHTWCGSCRANIIHFRQISVFQKYMNPIVLRIVCMQQDISSPLVPEMLHPFCRKIQLILRTVFTPMIIGYDTLSTLVRDDVLFRIFPPNDMDLDPIH